jgi:hypothetical protein
VQSWPAALAQAVLKAGPAVRRGHRSRLQPHPRPLLLRHRRPQVPARQRRIARCFRCCRADGWSRHASGHRAARLAGVAELAGTAGRAAGPGWRAGFHLDAAGSRGLGPGAKRAGPGAGAQLAGAVRHCPAVPWGRAAALRQRMCSCWPMPRSAWCWRRRPAGGADPGHAHQCRAAAGVSAHADGVSQVAQQAVTAGCCPPACCRRRPTRPCWRGAEILAAHGPATGQAAAAARAPAAGAAATANATALVILRPR